MRTLLVSGHIYSAAEPFASAVLVEDSTIAWIGTDAGADVHVGDVDTVVDLAGDLITPGFVHLDDASPSQAGGFSHGDSGSVTIADQWDDQAWNEAAEAALAVVPRDPCRLRSRIATGAPTALVPLPGQVSGWQTLRSAVHEVHPDERISARAAFSALTRGAWRLLGHPDRGVLVVGAEATFAQWQVADLVVETPDERISNWSTDPRAATPGLPPLDSDHLPTLRRLWRSGL
ncbi:MAG: hypothetical protein MUF33_05040 [Candidatus Nanopelagicales bacterium]|nr:hypothetical protein [Candidatus Nanopelagicales bacterium]